VVWTVVYHPEAERELGAIPVLAERVASVHAVEKLEALGPDLPFPHQSHIEGPIRELRPRELVAARGVLSTAGSATRLSSRRSDRRPK